MCHWERIKLADRHELTQQNDKIDDLIEGKECKTCTVAQGLNRIVYFIAHCVTEVKDNFKRFFTRNESSVQMKILCPTEN